VIKSLWLWVAPIRHSLVEARRLMGKDAEQRFRGEFFRVCVTLGEWLIGPALQSLRCRRPRPCSNRICVNDEHP
jgi:hypothetical protein